MGDSYPPDHGPVDAAQSRLACSVPVSSARDTQFVGFAECLFQALQPDLTTLFVALGSRREQDIVWAESIIQSIIARHAYDLVSHTILHVEISALDMLPHEECVQRIPDMTKWEAQ